MGRNIAKKNIYVSINNNMSQIGDRVYISSTQEFGTVKKLTFLGKPGILVSSDIGETLAFDDKRANAEIYNKDTGMNGDGDVIEIPMDVSVEGTEILTGLNISATQQKLFFLKFTVGLSQEEKEGYINEFNSVKDDETQRQAFVEGLMSELDDDTKLVQSVGSKALFDIEDEIKGNMFTKLLSEVSKEEREELMLEWMGVKNNRKAKEEFLHKMHSQLMTDDELIKVEGIRALSTIGINGDEQGVLFSKFLSETDDETKHAFIEEWEKVRSSPSKSREFLKNLVAGLQASS